ncbi:MAG: aminotransferase [Desulfuromonas sp.]|nr:aminotransferase [Desulfuromonas sp.]
MKLSSRLQEVTYPPITEVKSWIAGRQFPAGKPLVDLCQAIPDYPPHPSLISHLQQRMVDPAVAIYSPDEGLTEVRSSVSRWYQRRYGAAPAAGKICLTIGASQAFWLAMMTLCQSGDEVVVQLPAYFDHPMGMDALGIVPRYVAFDEHGGLPDPQAIERAITAKTRAILLVTPSNPTGAILPPALIDELYQLASAHNIALILDETYNAFLPTDQPPHGLFAKPEWPQNFIHIASFGKTFALTGYRAGALVAGEELIQQALKVQDSMVVCQPRITQHAVAYGCDHLDDWVNDNAQMMQQRHDLFRQLFCKPGNPFTLCASGAFFAWVRHPWPQLMGRQAARRLADEANVICLPGEVFGPGLEGYLRLAFGNVRLDDIPRAVARFIPDV